MLAVDVREVRRLALEELVARRTETLPHLIGVAARHGADLLPAGLQGDQFVGRLLPLLAHLQRLGRLAQLILQLEVVLHLGLHTGIEAAFGLEETVAGRAEPLVDARVVLLRGETDGLPHLLNLQQTVVGAVPLLARGAELLRQLLGLLAEARLQLEILQLLGLDILEESLMLLVDAARSLLETLPERLLELVGHGARLAPLVVEFLQLAERLDDRRLQRQRLGRLAQRDLLLVILLQIEVAQFLVDLDEVIEILDVQVVGLPQVLDTLLRNRSRLLPALLQLAELVERMVERLQIGLLLGLERRDELVAPAAVLAEQVLEPQLLRVGRRHELRLIAARLDEGAAPGLHLGAVRFVEGDLDGFHHAAQRLHRLLVEHPCEERDHLLLALAAEERIRRIGAALLRFTLGRLLVVEPRAAGGQRRLLVCEIDLAGRLPRYVSHGRLAGSCGRSLGDSLRNGNSVRRRCGGRTLRGGSGGNFGNGRFLHIFSIADLFLGNRRVGDFSSHLTLSFD